MELQELLNPFVGHPSVTPEEAQVQLLDMLAAIEADHKHCFSADKNDYRAAENLVLVRDAIAANRRGEIMRAIKLIDKAWFLYERRGFPDLASACSRVSKMQFHLTEPQAVI
jgi:hypothetical protein